jgi:hypothetical protein
MVCKIIPQRNTYQELSNILSALAHIKKGKLIEKMYRRRPITLMNIIKSPITLPPQ